MPDLTCWFSPGPEYGTTEAAWKAVLVEADRRCELHLRVKDNLLNEVSERYIWIVNTTVWSGGEQYKELAEGQLPQADDAIEGEKGDGGAVQKSSKALGKAFREGGQVQGEIWLSTRPTSYPLLFSRQTTTWLARTKRLQWTKKETRPRIPVCLRIRCDWQVWDQKFSMK